MAYQLLFVCLGNICRSPSAEGIMNSLIQQRGLEKLVQCDSAGTASYHIGSSPDRRMTAAAANQGIVLSGKARQFRSEDLQSFDLILAMDSDNYRDILRLDPTGKFQHKVKMMCSFCRHHSDMDVPDPYYGGADGFKYVVDLLLDACEGLLDDIEPELAKVASGA